MMEAKHSITKLKFNLVKAPALFALTAILALTAALMAINYAQAQPADTKTGANYPPLGQITINLTSGWNMIGPVYASQLLNRLSTDCQFISSQAYYWNGQKYQATNQLRLTYGYWVKVPQSCQITFFRYYRSLLPADHQEDISASSDQSQGQTLGLTGRGKTGPEPYPYYQYHPYPSPPLNLHAGYNLISYPQKKALKDFQGCQFDGGAYIWDGQRYAETSILSPGRGYWLNAKQACTAKLTELIPPKPPIIVDEGLVVPLPPSCPEIETAYPVCPPGQKVIANKDDNGCIVGYYCGPITPPVETCSDDYVPVCGVDNQTYTNECLLNKAGVSKNHDGKCEPSVPANKYEVKLNIENNGSHTIDKPFVIYALVTQVNARSQSFWRRLFTTGQVRGQLAISGPEEQNKTVRLRIGRNEKLVIRLNTGGQYKATLTVKSGSQAYSDSVSFSL